MNPAVEQHHERSDHWMRTEAPPLSAQEALEGEPQSEPPARVDLRTRRLHLLIDLIALGVVFGVLLSYFRIPVLFSQTTTTGGDTAGHIYPPWYLETHLLPRGQISGWSPGWYDGFPMFTFYFPL